MARNYRYMEYLAELWFILTKIRQQINRTFSTVLSFLHVFSDNKARSLNHSVSGLYSVILYCYFINFSYFYSFQLYTQLSFCYNKYRNDIFR